MEKQAKIIVSIASAILGITIATILGLYFRNFSGPMSSDPDDWGAFGDYISGTLNTVIALLNAIAFVWLTYVIHQHQIRQEKRQRLLPFLQSAMTEMEILQRTAALLSSNQPAPEGSISDFKVRSGQLRWRSATYLQQAGVDTDRLLSALNSSKDVKGVKQILRLPSGDQRVEFIFNDEEKLIFARIFVLLTADLNLLTRYITQ